MYTIVIYPIKTHWINFQTKLKYYIPVIPNRNEVRVDNKWKANNWCKVFAEEPGYINTQHK